MSIISTSFKLFEEKLPGIRSFAMVQVERGTFLLNDRIETDISSFWIGQHQVSQELWQEVMDENSSRFKGKNLPVERVSWNDTQVFIEKLNRRLELSGNRVYRLPTEAEWEYAARGGKYSLGTTYSGSKNLEKVAWYGSLVDKGRNEPQQLGLKAPNELGLYDMSGNVREWCQD